jgi:hypothetical protein
LCLLVSARPVKPIPGAQNTARRTRQTSNVKKHHEWIEQLTHQPEDRSQVAQQPVIANVPTTMKSSVSPGMLRNPRVRDERENRPPNIAAEP